MSNRAASKSAGRDLDAVFDQLREILSRHAKQFTVREGHVKDKRDYHLILQKPLIIDGRRKDELWFASIIQQKHNVGFYFMPIYCSPEVNNQISRALLDHLDGKCCFHMTELTPQLKKDIEASLKVGLAAYKEKGWL